MESLSGVKAHTIRIWEKRYNIVNPKRTSSNIRYYTDEDLRHLLNVCILYKNGLKISKIASMSDNEIKDRIHEISQVELNVEDKLDSLLLFILELDSYNFNKVLNKHISYHGLEKTMEDLIYPLMDKLSMAWLSGSFQDVHESFVSQLIKSKISHAIEKLGDKPDASPCFIIFLPEGEKQELSLMYLQYLLKKSGCKVVNLGNDVNLSDVLYAIDACQVDYVFTILNEEITSSTLKEYVSEICNQLGNKLFLLTGFQTLRINADKPDNLRIIGNLQEMIDFIALTKS